MVGQGFLLKILTFWNLIVNCTYRTVCNRLKGISEWPTARFMTTEPSSVYKSRHVPSNFIGFG